MTENFKVKEIFIVPKWQLFAASYNLNIKIEKNVQVLNHTNNK